MNWNTIRWWLLHLLRDEEMAKKTWIKVKRGLLEPKHIERLGVRFFLYLYYLDQANWEKGAVLFYRDRDAADELGMPISTVRKQRVRLEEDKYISCLQKKDHQVITIHNWTNPREYSGKVYNQGIQKCAPKQTDAESAHKGNHKGIATVDTPSSNSHITHHNKERLVKDMLEGFKAHKAGKNKNDDYPPDVIGTVTAFEKHFKIKPPRSKDSGYSLWIKSAREINRLSSDYKISPAEAIKGYFLSWDREGRGYSINSPQSILKSLRGYLGERESGEEFIGADGKIKRF